MSLLPVAWQLDATDCQYMCQPSLCIQAGACSNVLRVTCDMSTHAHITLQRV